MLVALENVYAVLRAEDPTAPAKILMGSFIDDVTANVSGTFSSVSVTLRHLENVRATLGAPSSRPVADGETTLIHIDDVLPLLAMEHPRTEANVTAQACHQHATSKELVAGSTSKGSRCALPKGRRGR